MTTMRAARLVSPGEPLLVEDVPVPVPGTDEVLVEVRACGICGTDLHLAVDGDLPTKRLPITPGHEPAGVIADVNGQARLQPGEHVGLLPAASCGTCRWCVAGREPLCESAEVYGMDRDGALAEYIAVPARSVVPLPANVPFDVAAIVTDAVATPFHALRCRGQLREGETVCIFGCGGIGTHAIVLAQLLGAASVVAVDADPIALARAHRVGAELVLDASSEDVVAAVRAHTGGSGVDLALECVGRAATAEQAIRCVGKQGRAVLVGVSTERPMLPPLHALVGREQSVLASYGAHRSDVEELYSLIAAGELDLSGSISARYPLSEADAALAHLARREGDIVRIVVEPQLDG